MPIGIAIARRQRDDLDRAEDRALDAARVAEEALPVGSVVKKLELQAPRPLLEQVVEDQHQRDSASTVPARASSARASRRLGDARGGARCERPRRVSTARSSRPLSATAARGAPPLLARGARDEARARCALTSSVSTNSTSPAAISAARCSGPSRLAELVGDHRGERVALVEERACRSPARCRSRSSPRSSRRSRGRGRASRAPVMPARE